MPEKNRKVVREKILGEDLIISKKLYLKRDQPRDKILFFLVFFIFITLFGCVTMSVVDQCRDRRDIPGLVEILRDKSKSYFYRRDAAEALGEMGNESIIPELIEALNDSNELVRQAVVEALGRRGGKSIVPVLIGVVKDEAESPKVIAQAIYALLNIEDNSAIPVICKSLEHEDLNVRRAAAAVLGKMGDKEAVPSLISALRRKDKKIFSDVATALWKINDRTAVPALLEALPDSEAARSHIVWVVGDMGDSSAIPTLINIIKDKNMIVGILELILKIGNKSIPPELEKILDRKDEFFRIYARWASQGHGQVNHKIPQEVLANKDKLLVEATNDFVTGNFDGAARKILQVMKSCPDVEQIKGKESTITLHQIACYNLGVVYTRLGKIDEAREAFLAALQLDPGSRIAGPSIFNYSFTFRATELSVLNYYLMHPPKTSVYEDIGFMDIEGNSFLFSWSADFRSRKVSFFGGLEYFHCSPITPLGLGWIDFHGKNFEVR